MSHSMTIQLPDKVYQQVTQAAKLYQQPAELIILRSLKYTLPPLLDEIPAQYQADVFPLLAMDDGALQQEAQQTFPADRWQAYETLLNRKKSAVLTDEDEQQLTQLRHEADALMFRRSYAAVLLKRRGHALPTLQELQQGASV